MDPTIIFTRLIASAQREEGLVDYFNCELNVNNVHVTVQRQFNAET